VQEKTGENRPRPCWEFHRDQAKGQNQPGTGKTDDEWYYVNPY